MLGNSVRSFLALVLVLAPGLPAVAQDGAAPDEPAGPEIPAGTRVTVRTVVQIDTEMAAGQTIAVRLAEDVESGGHAAVRQGARGTAEVVDVRGTDGDEETDIRVAFRLKTLRVDGDPVPFVSGPAGLSSLGGSVRQTGPGEVVHGSRGGIELRDEGRRLVIRSGTKVVFELITPAAIPRP